MPRPTSCSRTPPSARRSGVTAFADDADGTDTVTYSLDDDAGGRFTHRANTGVVTVAGGARPRDGHQPTTLRSGPPAMTARPPRRRSRSPSATWTSSTSARSPTRMPRPTRWPRTPIVGTTVGVTGLATDADATDNTMTYSARRRCRRPVCHRRQHGRGDRGRRARLRDGRPATTSRSAPPALTARSPTRSSRSTSPTSTNSTSARSATPMPRPTAVRENAVVGTAVGVTAIATDPDGTDTVTYIARRRCGRSVHHRRQHGHRDRGRRPSTARRRPATTSRSGPPAAIRVHAPTRRSRSPSTTWTSSTSARSPTSDAAANTVAEDAIVGTTVGVTGLASDADATDNAMTYTPGRRCGRPVRHRRQYGRGDRGRGPGLRDGHQPQRHDPRHQHDGIVRHRSRSRST